MKNITWIISNRFLSFSRGWGGGFDGDSRTRQAWCRSGQGDLARRCGGLEDGETLALERVALGGLERFMAGIITVAHRGDGTGAAEFEGNKVISPGTLDPIFVDYGYFDVGDIVPIMGQLSAVRGKDDFSGFAGGAKFVRGDNLVLVFAERLEGAGFKRNLPGTRCVIGVARL